MFPPFKSGNTRTFAFPATLEPGAFEAPTDGTIAASVSNLAECVRTAIVDMNIAPAEAIYSATATPAAALGMAGRVGRIAPGFAADLVLMNEGWTVDWVMKRGKSVT